MFGWKHYVPILKWKRAEMVALSKLDAERRVLITPFIQILMPPPKATKKGEPDKTPGQMLNESISLFKEKAPLLVDEIVTYWGSDSAFVDLSLVDSSLRLNGIKTILSRAHQLQAHLIPVLRFHDDDKFRSSLIELSNKFNTGLCLRLLRADCQRDGELPTKLKRLLADYKLPMALVDLVIDFQDQDCPDTSELLTRVPEISKWRTLTFVCGSFPVDLTKCAIGANFIDRSDWLSWLKFKTNHTLKRCPSFGDYTIQHPIYKESVRFFTPSASIRYTLKDKWIVMRGQKGKSEQYPANAQLITKDPGYFGKGYSYGDQYIAEKGGNLKGKPGNATTWLTAGINHHLVCTADQIANLT